MLEAVVPGGQRRRAHQLHVAAGRDEAGAGQDRSGDGEDAGRRGHGHEGGSAEID